MPPKHRENRSEARRHTCELYRQENSQAAGCASLEVRFAMLPPEGTSWTTAFQTVLTRLCCNCLEGEIKKETRAIHLEECDGGCSSALQNKLSDGIMLSIVFGLVFSEPVRLPVCQELECPNVVQGSARSLSSPSFIACELLNSRQSFSKLRIVMDLSVHTCAPFPLAKAMIVGLRALTCKLWTINPKIGSFILGQPISEGHPFASQFDALAALREIHGLMAEPAFSCDTRRYVLPHWSRLGQVSDTSTHPWI